MTNISKFFKQKVSILLAVVMTIMSSIAIVTPVSAQDMTTRAGVETLPYGSYEIGGFTFTNTNLTPVKTVAGSKFRFDGVFCKAASDRGIGPVKLTVQVRDANTGEVISTWVSEQSREDMDAIFLSDTIDLGYAGRKIQFWFDASSVGQSNGHYRSIEIMNFSTYVF